MLRKHLPLGFDRGFMSLSMSFPGFLVIIPSRSALLSAVIILAYSTTLYSLLIVFLSFFVVIGTPCLSVRSLCSVLYPDMFRPYSGSSR